MQTSRARITGMAQKVQNGADLPRGSDGQDSSGSNLSLLLLLVVAVAVMLIVVMLVVVLVKRVLHGHISRETVKDMEVT